MSETDHAASRLAPVRRLLSVMATLRGAQGCPWDRAQTHRSLVPYLVEEAYELIEVIESGGASGDETALREELGDVLLQVVFHARIAEERGAFSFADVANTLADKLETRHPHVFGGRPLDSPEAVRHAWHRRKMAGRDSALAGVPAAQPALNRALQVSERAARSGFEWSHEGEILAKVGEELAEFRQAAARHAGDAPAGEAPSLQEETELGDLLFALVQLARWRRIDPESALRRATRKFMARFGWMEDTLRARGLQPDRQTPAQWWALWDEAKSHAP